MRTTHLEITAHRGWCIRIGNLFDIEVTRALLSQCYAHRHSPPRHLQFDLTRTCMLTTVGIGAMLHIKSAYQVATGNAVILYHLPEVGDL